jgi:ATP adenylyltransferase
LRLEQIWAPWRQAYLKADPTKQPAASEPRPELSLPPGADPTCFFCRALADTADRENLVIHRGTHAMVMLNRYPYNNGHLLIAPRQHLGRLDQIDTATHAECVALLTRLTGLMERLLTAQGFNIGLNLGRAAGAGVPGHLHWHIVPRWPGDTNFMPVLGEVHVISQSLDALWELLAPELAKEKEATSSDA